MYTIYEMKNMFEIGRTLEVKIRDGYLDYDIDSKYLFSIALEWAREFEVECPFSNDDYYGEIDEFVNLKIKEELK